jgi:negative regulator of replication initiation
MLSSKYVFILYFSIQIKFVIIEKLLFNMKEQKTEFALINFLEKESHIIDYPPCLNELLVSVANENPDKNIKRFMKIKRVLY